MTYYRSTSAYANVDITPKPRSELHLISTSNTESSGNGVTIGEYATFHINYTIPEGITLSPTVFVRTWNATSGILRLVNASFIISPNIVQNSPSMDYSDYNEDSYIDTVLASFSSLYNPPDNVFDENDIVILEVITIVTPSVINVPGTTFTITSIFSNRNATDTITEKPILSNLVMLEPVLDWTITWENHTGDAGDTISYTIVVSHDSTSTAAAYNLDFIGMLRPYFDIISSSIFVNATNFRLVIDSIRPGYEGSANVPKLDWGNSIYATFNATLDISVQASSTVTSYLSLMYYTSPTNGRTLYLICNFTFLLVYFASRIDISMAPPV